jgi:hypothetical protein
MDDGWEDMGGGNEKEVLWMGNLKPIKGLTFGPRGNNISRLLI